MGVRNKDSTLRQKAGPLISRKIKLVGDTFRPKRVHTKRQAA